MYRIFILLQKKHSELRLAHIKFLFVILYLPIQSNIHKVNIFWRWIQYFIVQCIVRELSCGLPLKQQDIRIMKIKANKNYFLARHKNQSRYMWFRLNFFHWKQVFFLPPIDRTYHKKKLQSNMFLKDITTWYEITRLVLI